VSDYTPEVRGNLTVFFAAVAGVPPSQVTIDIQAGSVNLRVEIRTPASAGSTVLLRLQAASSSPQALTTLMSSVPALSSITVQSIDSTPTQSIEAPTVVRASFNSMGAIVGGVVGGFFFLVILIVRRRGTKKIGVMPEPVRMHPEYGKLNGRHNNSDNGSEAAPAPEVAAEGVAPPPPLLAPPTAPPTAPPPLPQGWAAVIDPASGETYYMHAASGSASWDAPTTGENTYSAAAPLPAPITSAPDTSAAAPLPPMTGTPDTYTSAAAPLPPVTGTLSVPPLAPLRPSPPPPPPPSTSSSSRAASNRIAPQ
jgi:hypothetical protein